MMQLRKYILNIINGFYSLLQGMAVTIKYFFKKPITLQYPYERWTLPKGYRGLIRLIPEKCTSCVICVKNCPNHCIDIKFDIGEDKKRKLREYNLDFSLCMFCGICVETCPFSALANSQIYEVAEYDRKSFVYNKERLAANK